MIQKWNLFPNKTIPTKPALGQRNEKWAHAASNSFYTSQTFPRPPVTTCSQGTRPDAGASLASTLCVLAWWFDHMATLFVPSRWAPTLQFFNAIFSSVDTFATSSPKSGLRRFQLSAHRISKTFTICATTSPDYWETSFNAFPKSSRSYAIFFSVFHEHNVAKRSQCLDTTTSLPTGPDFASIQLPVPWKGPTQLHSDEKRGNWAHLTF